MRRRELTAEERQEAERLNAAWLSYKAQHKGATQTWLAAESGLGTQGAVGQYLRGVIPLNIEALIAICRVIEADPKTISHRLTSRIAFNKMGVPDASHSETSNIELVSASGQVPLISWVQAGAWCEATDIYNVGDAEEWLSCPVRHGPRTYALRVRGESMRNPGSKPSFDDGDIIFVDPDLGATHKSLVITKLDQSNEVTFKRLLIDGTNWFLEALNPAWPNRISPIKTDAHVCGVVIARLESFI